MCRRSCDFFPVRSRDTYDGDPVSLGFGSGWTESSDGDSHWNGWMGAVVSGSCGRVRDSRPRGTDDDVGPWSRILSGRTPSMVSVVGTMGVVVLTPCTRNSCPSGIGYVGYGVPYPLHLCFVHERSLTLHRRTLPMVTVVRGSGGGGGGDSNSEGESSRQVKVYGTPI